MAIRVLLVDDAQEMRGLVALSLRLTGDFDVVGEAADGRAGVALAAERRPDLVLLDLSMPEMDGLEALPLIRRAAPAAVVVVFSGFEDEQLGRDARRLGAADFVEKGTPLDELARRLRAAYAAATAPPP